MLKRNSRTNVSIPAIVVIGQSPELANGQSKMIGYLLGLRFDQVSLIYVPMRFSSQNNQMGKASLAKVWRLVGVVFMIWRAAIKLRFARIRPILFYPPASPNLTPVLRDMVILILCRPFFTRTIFHFHAAGLAGFRTRLPGPLRPLFDLAYRAPDFSVATAQSGLIDGRSLNSKTNLVIYNGITDDLPVNGRQRPLIPAVVRLLFVGLLVEDKGILVLLEALARLKARGVSFEAQVIGSFYDESIEQRIRQKVRSEHLDEHVVFLGELRGDPVLHAYTEADIFCFPSFYAAESFGLVCVEAMRASLPVVATNWRGIPEVVVDGVTGLIVPPCLPEPLADALARLINDADLRDRLGRAGRERYLSHFTLDHFRTEMGELFRRAIEGLE